MVGQRFATPVLKRQASDLQSFVRVEICKVRPRRICNWVVVRAPELSELLVAKDKPRYLTIYPAFPISRIISPIRCKRFPEVVIPPVVDTCTLRMRGRQREPRRLMD
jgi:hypothetical protein